MKSPLNAHEATALFISGDERGFDYFFNILYSRLMYFASHIMYDRDEAKDPVSRSFVKLWEMRAMFTHPKQIRSWMYSTVKNDCLNTIVSDQRREKRHDKASSSIQVTEQCIEENIIRSELYAELSTHIDKLPKGCAKIFRLFLQDKSVREISEILNISISTVKNQKMTGLKLLFKYYTELPKVQDTKPVPIIKETSPKRKPNYMIVGEFIEKGLKPRDIQAITGFKINSIYVSINLYKKSLKTIS